MSLILLEASTGLTWPQFFIIKINKLTAVLAQMCHLCVPEGVQFSPTLNLLQNAARLILLQRADC